MSAYLFVAAAVVAVVSVVIVVNISVKKLIADPSDGLRVQKQFFITVGLTKLLPVVLLILGIVKLTHVDEITDLLLPWSIILITIVVGLSLITRQKKLGKSDDEKFAINTIVTIARPLLFSIPIMAAAFIFLMTK